LMSYLLFQRVYSFKATDRSGGQILHTADNFMISLAPYFLPVFTIPLLIIKPFIINQTQPAVNLLIGVTFGFHLIGLFKEFRFYQSDIKMSGIVFSLCIIILLNILILVIVLSGVYNSYLIVWYYLKKSFVDSMNYYSFCFLYIYGTFSDFFHLT